MLKAVSLKSERVGSKANIVVQAKNIEEAHSKESREAALEYGKTSMGMNRPGISGTPWMEWVDSEGKPLSSQKTFEATNDKSVHISWPVQEGL
jgi:hypothetical protein